MSSADRAAAAYSETISRLLEAILDLRRRVEALERAR